MVDVICKKMMQSEEIVMNRRRINSNVIHAVVLHLAIGAQKNSGRTGELNQKDVMELFKIIALKLNDDTR